MHNREHTSYDEGINRNAMVKRRFRSTLCWGVLVLGGMSSCAVGPDYVAPEMQSEAQFSEGASDNFSTNESPSNWWKAFGDVTLDELIQRAVINNKDIDIAIARINHSRALAREAFLELLPGAHATGSYIKNKSAPVRSPGFSSSGIEYELYSVGFDALWEIDLFGGLRRGLEAQNAIEEASIADLQDVVRSVVADIARNYFQLRGAQLRLDVTNQNVRIQEETLALAEAREQAGATSELDTAGAKTQLYSTRAAVPPLDATIKSAIHRLSVLVGCPPQELKPLLKAAAPIPIYRGPIAIGDPAGLLRRRPDIRSAERKLASATASVGVAVSNLYPKITFEGSLGVEAGSPDDWARGGTTSYLFGPRLEWSILEFGRVIARIRAADATAAEAISVYEQAVLVALEEAENALVNFSTERMRRDELLNAVKTGQRALELAKIQYTSGATDLLTVLEAQRSVLANEADLAISETQLATNLVAIYKALGGGWEENQIVIAYGSAEK